MKKLLIALALSAGFVYTLPKEFDLGVKYYTNTGMSNAFQAANTVNGQKLYKNAVVVSLTKTFN